MSERDQARRQFLDEMGALVGPPISAEPEAIADLELTLAGAGGEPVDWTSLLGKWTAIQPELALHQASDDDGEFVETAFQAAIDRIGDHAFEPEILHAESPTIRMLIATRAIEGQVDNGGWPAVFYNAVDGLLPLAIEGYKALGLRDHAALASRVLAHGFQDDAEDEARVDADWEAFDEAWFALAPPEKLRAEHLRAHPEELR